jgi:hypothetical protein
MLVRGTSCAVAKDVLCELGVPLTAHLKLFLRPAEQAVVQPKAAEQPRLRALQTLKALQLGRAKPVRPTLPRPLQCNGAERILSLSEAAELFEFCTDAQRPAYRVAMAERKVRRPLADKRTTLYAVRRDRTKPPGRDIADPMHPLNRGMGARKPPTSSKEPRMVTRPPSIRQKVNQAAGAHRF